MVVPVRRCRRMGQAVGIVAQGHGQQLSSVQHVFPAVFQRLPQGRFHAKAVGNDALGHFQLEHVGRCGGIIMRASRAGGDDQTDLHVRHLMGDGPGKQPERIGGGGHGKGGSPCPDRQKQQEQQKQNDTETGGTHAMPPCGAQKGSHYS